MPISLTDDEKQSVIEIMETLYGYDSALVGQKHAINDRTVDALEEAIDALEKCNADLKDLVVQLAGPAGPSKAFLAP